MSLEWAVISKLLPFESVFLQWMAILSGQLAARRYLSKVGWIFEGNVRRGRGQGGGTGGIFRFDVHSVYRNGKVGATP